MSAMMARQTVRLFLTFCVSGSVWTTRAQDIVSYGKECAANIAPVPTFDCRNGVLAPVTVDGVQPASYQPKMTCDRPSILPYGPDASGQCVPYSRALVLVDDDKAQISAFCREKQIRPADTHFYDEIDVIAHSVSTGKTCWFQATGSSLDHPLNGVRVPPPDIARSASFWNPPRKTAAEKCVVCHDSGPFVYSPFIAQTGQIPADPLGKYTNAIGIDFQKWPQPLAISVEGNTCVSCHRIGSMNTCTTMIHQASGAPTPGNDHWAGVYPNSHWMPPANWLARESWLVVYKESVEKLSACCANHAAPGCIVTKIPGE
jgi:hypothetical protein